MNTRYIYGIWIHDIYKVYEYTIYIRYMNTWFFAGKSPNIQSHTMYMYGSGQPYKCVCSEWWSVITWFKCVETKVLRPRSWLSVVECGWVWLRSLTVLKRLVWLSVVECECGWVWLSVVECGCVWLSCGWGVWRYQSGWVWLSDVECGWVWFSVVECGWMWLSCGRGVWPYQIPRWLFSLANCLLLFLNPGRARCVLMCWLSMAQLAKVTPPHGYGLARTIYINIYGVYTVFLAGESLNICHVRYLLYTGLARTTYLRCTYGIFGRGITKYTVTYGVYMRFWPTLHTAHQNERE